MILPQIVSEPAVAITQGEDITFDIDVSRITAPSDTPTNSTISTSITEIENIALTQNQEFEAQVSQIESNNTIVLPSEIQKQVKVYTIKDIFLEQAQKMSLPQFHIKVPSSEIFGNENEVEILLEKDSLLKGFVLSKADTNISFENISSDLYRVDIDETTKDHTPTFLKVDGKSKEFIMSYLLDPARKESRVKNFSKRIMSLIGNMYPMADKDVEKYINRVLEDFTDEQFNDLASKEYSYTDKIKQKIKSLSESYAEKKFKDYLDTDKVYLKPSFTLPNSISPGETAKAIAKSLYEKEGKINGFEERVINEIANMSNIAFWTRNIEKRGFKINGFINHYPDFIIQSKSGKTIVLETKGDHLDAEQKISLGSLWASAAGNNYKYFMVYERRTVDGAYKLDEFINLMRDM